MRIKELICIAWLDGYLAWTKHHIIFPSVSMPCVCQVLLVLIFIRAHSSSQWEFETGGGSVASSHHPPPSSGSFPWLVPLTWSFSRPPQHYSQQPGVEATWVSSANEWTHKMWCFIYNTCKYYGIGYLIRHTNGVLFSLKKEQNSDTCYTVDESWRVYVKWSKLDTKGQISVWFHVIGGS